MFNLFAILGKIKEKNYEINVCIRYTWKCIFCNKLKEAYNKEQPEKLILLGDLLYNKSLLSFGRNNERQKTAGILNDLMDYIIAVRGNCDTDLDQALLYFPIMSDYKN